MSPLDTKAWDFRTWFQAGDGVSVATMMGRPTSWNRQFHRQRSLDEGDEVCETMLEVIPYRKDKPNMKMLPPPGNVREQESDQLVGCHDMPFTTDEKRWGFRVSWHRGGVVIVPVLLRESQIRTKTTRWISMRR